VISTIHQPSSEVFHLFDRVLLLTAGRLIFDGNVDGAGGMSEYFSSIGKSLWVVMVWLFVGGHSLVY